MMNDFEFFHGVVLARLVHGSSTACTLRRFDALTNAGYVLNDSVGLYIKHCSKRLTPWRFSFSAAHISEVVKLHEHTSGAYVLLVCNDDGIVCLSYEEWDGLVDRNGMSQSWISADRHKREKYLVTGSKGALATKIARSDFPEKCLGSATKAEHTPYIG